MTERRRNAFILLLVAGLLVASVGAILAKKTRLGLDLKGGVELVYQAKPTREAKVTSDSINRSLDIMRSRVDQLGVSEPEIQRSGADQINVSLPAVKNQARAVAQVGKTAQMFFYDWETNVVGPNGKPDPANFNVTGGPSAGTAGSLNHYDAIIRASKRPPANPAKATTEAQFFLVNTKTHEYVRGPEASQADLFSERAQKAPGPGERVVKVNPGTLVVRAESPDKGPKLDKWYVLNDSPALSGTDIKNPEQQFDSGTGGTGQPIVTFDFTGKGRKVWQDTTRAIAQRGQAFVPANGGLLPPLDKNQHFAIVLDNELVSVPYIDYQQNPDGIDARNGSQIQGSFTISSAQNLANLLKSGALPIKLELISASQVSATLGKQALHQGLIAGIVGFAVVALFLLFFYRVLGLIAVGALVVYAIYLYALIKLIPITLTLPGIAGLILTIGVAADANIVIFERVKEEIRGGRSVAAGIAAGYKRGIAAIIDANVVTFMTAFILFILATAGVKGFAFVLGVGTLVSLFTAVLMTQAVLGVMGRSPLISHPRALGAGETKHPRRFDFMGASKWFFSASGTILLVGALAIGGKGLKFGIDFESGTRIQTALTQPTNENGVRSVLASQGLGDAKIQKITGNKDLGNNAFQISTSTLKPDQVSTVTGALDAKYHLAKPPNTQSIGPTFGNTVANSAIIAIIASLIVISAYIALRFEWKYAVPVLIALMHDLLITAGVFSLTGREVTTSTVAALLTILGFSLYDTIIVFDRIRENVPRMPRASFSQIVNRSMSEVLTRSLATSFCTALPVLALLLFGGQTLKDFAFALLVGVISGAYSSIFIASPVLTHWKERESVWLRRHARIASQFGGAVPAYATGSDGKPEETAPSRQPGGRRRRLTEPTTPEQGVSKAEFEQMVAELHVDAPTATKDRDPSADLAPEDVVMPKTTEKRDKPKRPRNKRHGRN